MAIYRERKRPRRLLMIAVLGVLAIALVVGSFLFRSLTPPADSLATARARALEAAQGLEVFSIEYPQAAQGAEQAGALGALRRARAAFESAQGDLARIDAPAVEQIAAAFQTLEAQASTRAPAAEVTPLAGQTRERLLALARAPR